MDPATISLEDDRRGLTGLAFRPGSRATYQGGSDGEAVWGIEILVGPEDQIQTVEIDEVGTKISRLLPAGERLDALELVTTGERASMVLAATLALTGVELRATGAFATMELATLLRAAAADHTWQLPLQVQGVGREVHLSEQGRTILLRLAEMLEHEGRAVTTMTSTKVEVTDAILDVAQRRIRRTNLQAYRMHGRWYVVLGNLAKSRPAPPVAVPASEAPLPETMQTAAVVEERSAEAVEPEPAAEVVTEEPELAAVAGEAEAVEIGEPPPVAHAVPDAEDARLKSDTVAALIMESEETVAEAPSTTETVSEPSELVEPVEVAPTEDVEASEPVALVPEAEAPVEREAEPEAINEVEVVPEAEAEPAAAEPAVAQEPEAGTEADLEVEPGGVTPEPAREEETTEAEPEGEVAAPAEPNVAGEAEEVPGLAAPAEEESEEFAPGDFEGHLRGEVSFLRRQIDAQDHQIASWIEETNRKSRLLERLGFGTPGSGAEASQETPEDVVGTQMRRELMAVRDDWLQPLVEQIRSLEQQVGGLDTERAGRAAADITALRAERDALRTRVTVLEQQLEAATARRSWFRRRRQNGDGQ